MAWFNSTKKSADVLYDFVVYPKCILIESAGVHIAECGGCALYRDRTMVQCVLADPLGGGT